MRQIWQLQDAKNKLSEVVEEALEHGPQVITKRGVEVAVVLSYRDFLKLRKSRGPLSEFFRRSPLADVELERDRSLARADVEL